ncbi:MAG: hypothetical protein IOC78_05545, partial [Rhodobacter sp.]|nr:hypothetical protein [Rhodobacter sp.]
RGPKPPASARPAHGGRFSPAGSGAGLCFSRTCRSTGHCRARAGETRCVSCSRPDGRSRECPVSLAGAIAPAAALRRDQDQPWAFGIDITHLAIGIIGKRLRDAFPRAQFTTRSVPQDIDGARDPAVLGKHHEFEKWALSLIAAQPGNVSRKGTDKGIAGGLLATPVSERSTKGAASSRSRRATIWVFR